jgi:hypothetical protein
MAGSPATPIWLCDMERVAREVVPDLKGRPLYVLRQSQLGRHPLANSSFLGATAPHFDQVLRDVIAGYHGRGPCLLVNDARLEFLPDDCAGVGFHELAHALLWLDRLGEAELPADIVRQTLAANARQATTPVCDVTEADWIREFRDHALPFIRVLAHVHHRIGRLKADWRTPSFSRLVSALHGVSRYMLAFEDEANRKLRWPIAAVLETKAPAPARQLWDEDEAMFQEFLASGFFRSQQERAEADTNAASSGRKGPRTMDRTNPSAPAPTEIAARLADKLKRRETAKVDSFRELVAQVAAGQEPDIRAVENALAGAGKTIADLQAAVALRVRRIAARQRLDGLPDAEARKAEAERLLTEAREVLTAAEAAFEAAAGPLEFDRSKAMEAILDAAAARRELEATCDDPATLASLADFASRRTALEAKERDLRGRVDRLERQIIGVEAQAIPHPDDVKAAEETRKRIEALRDELRDLRTQRDALADEERRARLQMLEP